METKPKTYNDLLKSIYKTFYLRGKPHSISSNPFEHEKLIIVNENGEEYFVKGFTKTKDEIILHV